VTDRRGDVPAAEVLLNEALDGFRSAGAWAEVAETQTRLEELATTATA
jgi:hypothetical protein